MLFRSPLRERKTDIPLLADKILKQLEKETGIPVEGLEPAALEILTAYAWPGNVRELRNTLEQIMHLKTCNTITVNDIPRTILATSADNSPVDTQSTLKLQMARLEEELIHRAIRETKGDKCAAADRLGISKSSLYAKVQHYGIKI